MSVAKQIMERSITGKKLKNKTSQKLAVAVQRPKYMQHLNASTSVFERMHEAYFNQNNEDEYNRLQPFYEEHREHMTRYRTVLEQIRRNQEEAEAPRTNAQGRAIGPSLQYGWNEEWSQY